MQQTQQVIHGNTKNKLKKNLIKYFSKHFRNYSIFPLFRFYQIWISIESDRFVFIWNSEMIKKIHMPSDHLKYN